MQVSIKNRMLFGTTIALLLSGGMISRPASAMPMFARKFKLPCARCHTMIPRLSPFGYAFYRAGFRLPNNPNNTSHTFENVAAAILDTQMQTATPAGDTGVSLAGAIHIAGAVDQHVSTHINYSFASSSDGGSGFADAWIRYNSAPMGTFWDASIGQIPTTNGYNLEGDRSWMLTDPMLMGNNGPLAGNGAYPQASIALSGLERGVSAGYEMGQLSTRVSWLNGLTESGAGDVDASSSGSRFHDAEVQFDYLPTQLPGSAISGLYYHGVTPLHDTVAVGNPMYNNDFYRAGLFGTYQRELKAGDQRGVSGLLFELNGGYLFGKDKIGIGGPDVYSDGGEVEADLYRENTTSLGVRYDWVRPAEMAGNPTTKAITVDLARRPSDLVKCTLEYRNQSDPGAQSLMAGVSLYY